MHALATIVMAAAVGSGDPVLECRAAHDVRTAEYVTCLEDALRRVSAVARDAGARERATVPAKDPAAAAAAALDGAGAPAARRELGADQLQQARRSRGEDGDQAVAIEIVAVEYGAEQLATVTLADGQQWRETSVTPRAKRLVAGRKYRGRIERGAVGGYRLYVEGIRNMYTVRRLR
jgi:hypothetical protein